MPIYLIQGQRLRSDHPSFNRMLEAAHAAQHRPLCLCRSLGIAMYVARQGDHVIAKRLPFSGSQHAPDCPSYEPPAELSGLGQVLGTAINENPDNGITALKLGFTLTKAGMREVKFQGATATSSHDRVRTDGNKLSLRGLLHYLWDQAELTHWHPGFAGKRSWHTVRKHLLQAAESKVARGMALAQRLYVPEVFSVAQSEAIAARRTAHFTQAFTPSKPGATRPLMLLIAEVKEIVPARYGYKAVIKHVPDHHFGLDDTLYRRLGKRFAAELSLWAASDAVHMIMIATFGMNGAGLPSIEECSLMPVTTQWIPIENALEQQLIEHLVREERSFIKGLRYNLPRGHALASATLVDVGAHSITLCIRSIENPTPRVGQLASDHPLPESAVNWVWHAGHGPIPELPSRISPGSDRQLGFATQTQYTTHHEICRHPPSPC